MIVVKRPYRILHFLGWSINPTLVAGLFKARFRGFLGSLWWEGTDTVKLDQILLGSAFEFGKKVGIGRCAERVNVGKLGM
jgi:hypothetical protein